MKISNLFFKQKEFYCNNFQVFVGAALVIFLICFSNVQGESPNQTFITLNNSKARPVAMGGAFFSITGDLETIYYNPAGFELTDKKFAENGFYFFLNPTLPPVVWGHPEDFGYDEKLKGKDIFSSLQYLIPSVVYQRQFLIIGITKFEETLLKKPGDKFFDSGDLYHNNYSAGFISLKLANRVNLGATYVAYSRKTKNGSEKKWGGSYGLLIHPGNNTSIGITYFDIPTSFSQVRVPIERIENETINIGFSYNMSPRILVSVDMRNVNEPDKDLSKEMHYGIEGEFLPHTAFRAGYYREKDSMTNLKKDVFSFGIGLIDMNKFRQRVKRLLHSDFIIDYALLSKKDTGAEISLWHFLNVNIRL